MGASLWFGRATGASISPASGVANIALDGFILARRVRFRSHCAKMDSVDQPGHVHPQKISACVRIYGGVQ